MSVCKEVCLSIEWQLSSKRKRRHTNRKANAVLGLSLRVGRRYYTVNTQQTPDGTQALRMPDV